MAKNAVPSLHGTKDEHESVLNSARSIMPYISGLPVLQQRSKPILWHPDLHMGNIFVSEEDHAQITCLIDWQSASVCPLFIQPRWPVFLNPPESYRVGIGELPKLPEDFDQLDSDEKDRAVYEKDNAMSSKAYEVATRINNGETYTARFSLDETLRGLFADLGDTWEDGIVPLQAHLVKVFVSWERMGFSPPCPVQFTSREIEALNRRYDQYAQFREVQSIARKYLSTDSEGWISPVLDFAEKKEQNRVLLELVIERFKNELTADEVKAIWPFPP